MTKAYNPHIKQQCAANLPGISDQSGRYAAEVQSVNYSTLSAVRAAGEIAHRPCDYQAWQSPKDAPIDQSVNMHTSARTWASNQDAWVGQTIGSLKAQNLGGVHLGLLKILVGGHQLLQPMVAVHPLLVGRSSGHLPGNLSMLLEGTLQTSKNGFVSKARAQLLKGILQIHRAELS